MSIAIMGAVFQIEDMGPTQRLILLALADHADEFGACYPSIARLCRRTGLKERAMQSNLRDLERSGYVRIMPGAGPRGCNQYIVSARPKRSSGGSAESAPPQDMHPPQEMRGAAGAGRISRTEPPHFVRQPPAGDAPKPSINHQEPPETREGVSFWEFFQKCPNRISEAKAASAWEKLSATERAEATAAVVGWYSWFKSKYPSASTPNPVTYLRDRRWRDLDAGGNTGQRASREDVLRFWADVVNSEGFVSQSAMGASTISDLIAAGLVSEERMRERGLI